MKKIFVVALAALSLSAGIAQAQTYGYERPPANHPAQNNHNTNAARHSGAEGEAGS